MASKREHPEEIPTRSNEEQTEREVQRQNEIQGEHREKEVSDFPTAASIGQILKDLNFPTDKHTILQFVKQADNVARKEEVLSSLQGIEQRTYENVAEVAEAAGVVED